MERPQSLARTRLGVTLAILDGSQSRSFLNSPRQRQAEFVLLSRRKMENKYLTVISGYKPPVLQGCQDVGVLVQGTPSLDQLGEPVVLYGPTIGLPGGCMGACNNLNLPVVEVFVLQIESGNKIMRFKVPRECVTPTASFSMSTVEPKLMKGTPVAYQDSEGVKMGQIVGTDVNGLAYVKVRKVYENKMVDSEDLETEFKSLEMEKLMIISIGEYVLGLPKARELKQVHMKRRLYKECDLIGTGWVNIQDAEEIVWVDIETVIQLLKSNLDQRSVSRQQDGHSKSGSMSSMETFEEERCDEPESESGKSDCYWLKVLTGRNLCGTELKLRKKDLKLNEQEAKVVVNGMKDAYLGTDAQGIAEKLKIEARDKLFLELSWTTIYAIMRINLARVCFNSFSMTKENLDGTLVDDDTPDWDAIKFKNKGKPVVNSTSFAQLNERLCNMEAAFGLIFKPELVKGIERLKMFLIQSNC